MFSCTKVLGCPCLPPWWIWELHMALRGDNSWSTTCREQTLKLGKTEEPRDCYSGPTSGLPSSLAKLWAAHSRVERQPGRGWLRTTYSLSEGRHSLTLLSPCREGLLVQIFLAWCQVPSRMRRVVGVLVPCLGRRSRSSAVSPG